MEYTVQGLATIAGISTRTLRYYDEIGILKPARINSVGYRIYGENEVNKLQQILFYRELGVSLEEIKKLIYAPSFDIKKALMEHYEKLLAKKEQINLLICNVEKTLETVEGRITMEDKEKFEGFKQKLVEENEKMYGDELREKYGEETIKQSNAKFMNMSERDYQRMKEVEEELFVVLKKAMETGNPAGELAQKAAELHKVWLSFTWNKYSKEAHTNLANMYTSDERFTAYYDKQKTGATAFLRDAILIYTGMSQNQ